MRKVLLAVAILGALFGSSLAKAAPDDSGNPSNTHGMCTAYFNGSQTGQEHKRQSNAFQVFVNYVGDNDGVDNDNDGDTDEGDEVASPVDVWNFCIDTAENPKGIGGQPDDPNTPTEDPNGKSGGHGKP